MSSEVEIKRLNTTVTKSEVRNRVMKECGLDSKQLNQLSTQKNKKNSKRNGGNFPHFTTPVWTEWDCDVDLIIDDYHIKVLNLLSPLIYEPDVLTIDDRLKNALKQVELLTRQCHEQTYLIKHKQDKDKISYPKISEMD
jgi:hypothetical protein